MKKEKVLELLSSNKTLLEEIAKIIGCEHRIISDSPIVNGLKLPWAFDDGGGVIYYARHEGDDIYNYEGMIVSSLANKIGEEMFMGESDSLTYVIGYDESKNWDDTYILILDNKNKESLTIDE